MGNTAAKNMARVLLVEDSPSDAVLLQENLLLSGNGNISVNVAKSLKEAAGFLKSNNIDAVLLDLTLPDSSGLDTVNWARRNCSSLPVVVLTGVDDETTGIAAVRMGIQDYLVKNRADGWAVIRAIHYAIERKKFEEALLERAQILDQMHDSVVWTDMEGRITGWNKGSQRLFGYAAEEAIGNPITILHPPEDEEFVRTKVIEPVKRNGSGELEVKLRRKSGEDIYAHLSLSLVKNAQGIATGMAGYALDITERKRMEAEIQRSYDELEQRVKERTKELSAEVAERKRTEEAVKAERQRMYDVMETLPVYIILLSEDYRVPYANRFFRERFGESHGKRCYEYLFSRTEPCENCHSFEVLKTNASLEWEWTGPDGRNYSVYDSPFNDTDGSRLILEMGIDVTEEKQLQLGLERKTDQLRELASELTLAEQRERRRIAEALHDNLQQLLVAAKLRVGLMRRDHNPAVKESAAVVDDLLGQSIAASRTLTAELSPSLLHEGGLVPALKWLEKWMGEKYSLAVKVNIEEDMPGIKEDIAVHLFQSVRELLFNSVKHAKVEEAWLDLMMKKDRIMVVVSDKGAGFDPSQLSIHGGKCGGFGLLSVRERLELMGGSMAVESAPGMGTRITLESPPLTITKAARNNARKGARSMSAAGVAMQKSNDCPTQ
jgi:PAS domain S-box-containing protein